MLCKITAIMIACGLALPALAQDVNITQDMSEAPFSVNGQPLTIARSQDQSAHLQGEFAKTSRACPPFCIHPMFAAEGVETLGELELITFLQTHASDGTGLLIDARMPEWFEKASIPGAVNVPFTTLEPGNPYRDDILKALGARETATGYDFSDVLHLTLFCNGPWDDESPRAIRDLIAAGYPADHLHYYRGGLQMWMMLGLTVEVPNG